MDFSNLIPNNASAVNYISIEKIVPIDRVYELSFIQFVLNNVVKPVMIFIGSLYSLKVSFYSFLNMEIALKLYVWPLIFKPNLKKYGEFVIITNTLDCIGTEFAKAFAKLGHSLVLIGENNETFLKVKREIESVLKEGRCVRVIVKDDSLNDDKIYQYIEDELQDIKHQIGILVNNAGVTVKKSEKFLEYTDDNVLDLVHSNIVDVLMITKAVLPLMVANKRGLLLNVTSPSNFRPVAFSGLPSAMKDFVDKFGRIIGGEYRIYNIDVQTLNPGWIMEPSSILSKVPSWLLPTAKTYVNSAMSTIGRSDQTCGYCGHSLINKLMAFVPNGIHTIIYYIYRKCSGKDKNLSKKQEVMGVIGVFKEVVKK